MKVYLLVVFAAMLQTINGFPRIAPDCSQYEDGEKLPDASSCSRYYLCVGGKSLPQCCASGLYFDAMSGFCNRAFLVDCAINRLGQRVEDALHNLGFDNEEEGQAGDLHFNPNPNTCSTPKTTTCSTTTCSTPKPTTCSTTTCSTPKPTTCSTTTCSTPKPTTCSTTTCSTPKPTTCSTTTCSTPKPTTCSTTTCSTPRPTTCSTTTCTTPTKPCSKSTTCSTTTCSTTTCSSTKKPPCTTRPTTCSTTPPCTTPDNDRHRHIPNIRYPQSTRDCFSLPSGTILLNPNHCRSYYICTHLRPRTRRCRPGYWIDRETLTCKRRSLVTNCLPGRD